MSTTEVSSELPQTSGAAAGGDGEISPGSSTTRFDWEYHVRRSALPRPARVREAADRHPRWHSSPLDRHRPLWEMHVVEGLSDGRLPSTPKCHPCGDRRCRGLAG
ncbi:wax ester/triacylglycerol synthase domain-containing protein [Mycobacteroides abscessus]|uniref:wax ester/triacylglycerol synthase domain-containing protein n=1 Tax=Mycobacteroides abscessus TaxID=36809 RepID=UPI00241536A6|nr:wax ester/triacylglycerol synthase domain-containing protein [Mycobacteroides abscessus]